jgi:hypothetical protein
VKLSQRLHSNLTAPICLISNIWAVSARSSKTTGALSVCQIARKMQADAVRRTAPLMARSGAFSHRAPNAKSHPLYPNNFTDRISVSINGREISEGFKDLSRADL